jgi:hypothetical protein
VVFLAIEVDVMSLKKITPIELHEGDPPHAAKVK